MIAWRGCASRTRAPDRFGAFLALGLTSMIAVQALMNISVVLGVLPTKGMPLPFVSAGGSSLLISLLAWASCSTCRSTRQSRTSRGDRTERLDACGDRPAV